MNTTRQVQIIDEVREVCFKSQNWRGSSWNDRTLGLKTKTKPTKHHIISESVLFLLRSEWAEIDISVAVTGEQRSSKVNAGQSGCESKPCDVDRSESPQQALTSPPSHLPAKHGPWSQISFWNFSSCYVILNSYLVCESITLICKIEKIIMARTEAVGNKVCK